MPIKKALRWFLVALLAYLLAISLLFLANAVVFRSIAARPDKIKAILDDSGVYQKIPVVLYEDIAKENQAQKTDIDLSDPKVKQAALDSFNPAFFESSVETALDGTYRWLEGETSQPRFTVDATKARNNFIKNIVEVEAARAEELPVCTFAQLRQINPGSVNIFNLKCRPPGVSIADQAEKAKTELRNNPEFLGETKLNAQDLKNEKGQPIFSANSELPEKFQLAKNLPLFLAVLSALLAIGLYLASPNKQQGLKRLSKILISVGFLTLLAPIMIKFLSGKLLPAVSGDKVVSEIITPVVREFNAAAASIYYLLGGIMLAAGILLIIAVYKNIFNFREAKKP